jgi:hypothetical protein
MFSYWGPLVLAPCLMMEPDFGALRRSFARFFAGFSSSYLLVAFIVPRFKGGVFFGFVLFAAGTTALNYFYVKYFKALAGVEAGEGAAPDSHSGALTRSHRKAENGST